MKIHGWNLKWFLMIFLSFTVPKTHHYSRCGLPLTLHCGHGVCYHCVVSKRSPSKHGLTNKGPDSTTISCAVCKCVSVVSHESVHNVLAVINCYQLGLIKLNELGVDVAGENIGFKGIMFNKKIMTPDLWIVFISCCRSGRIIFSQQSRNGCEQTPATFYLRKVSCTQHLNGLLVLCRWSYVV